MANELIEQVLSPDHAPYINGVKAELRVSPAILENVYQGLVEADGRGVNDKFVKEDDAVSSAQVQVNRVLPVKMKPREQGANKNGASFSANQHFVQTETVSIEILQTLDDPIIIPRARQDMIKVDLLATQTKIYSDRLRTIINGATFACKLLKSWTEESLGHEINKATFAAPAQASDPSILEQFIYANSLLDEGDTDHGIDIFPEDTRVAVFKTSYRAVLKAKGILVLGGANYAYDIARKAAISTESEAKRAESGYIGDIDDVPVHVISNESLQHASEFLGFEEKTLKNSPVLGYISSSYANARGVSTSKLTKVVDTRGGQGLELQPFCKFGVASWYAKGNVILASEDGFNPVASLKTIFASYVSSIAFKLKGAGSRLFPSVTVTSESLSATALDDWNVGHVVAVASKVGTTAWTLASFLKASSHTVAAAVSGAISGSSLASTDSTNKYGAYLVISDDGSVTFGTYEYAGA